MSLLKSGRLALPAGIFATLLWGSQAVVAVRAAPAFNFVSITLLLHLFALLGVTALNLSRGRGFMADLKLIRASGGAPWLWALSGACQAVCFLLFYLAVQNGPQVPGMMLHFMWPFVFALSNALFPSTWEQRSSGYEMKVVAVGAIGVWFLVESGLSIGAGGGTAGRGVLMLAGLLSAVFGCVNAVCDYHALARARAKVAVHLDTPNLPASFRYSALQIRFMAGFAFTLLLWALFGRHAGGVLTQLPPAAYLAPFWLGFVVYFGADFFFGYTMAHVSDAARSGFTYLPPLFGALLLCWNGAAVDQGMVFGVVIVLLSMFQLQAGTRAWTANTAAPLLFIASSIIVLHVPGVLKRAGLMGENPFNGINPEVMAGVFAIVISFLLSRLLDRNKSENMLEIENVNIMDEIISKAEDAVKDADVVGRIRNLAYSLSVYVLDFDVNTSHARRGLLIRKIDAVREGFSRAVRDAWPEAPEEAGEKLEELSRGISKWMYLRSQFLSMAEIWAVVLLSFSSIIAFLIATDRSPDWYGEIAAIALITTVLILVFQALDLGANRCETEVADLLNKQMPLLRHGFLPYVPFELMQKRAFVPEDKPFAVLTRRPDGVFERVYLPVGRGDIKTLARIVKLAAFAAVILLLLNRHGIVSLF